MLGGVFGRFPPVEGIDTRLRNFSYDHDLQGETVTAIAQLNGRETRIGHHNVRRGLAIDYEMLPHKEVRRDPEGQYYLHAEMRPTPISTEFEIIGRDFVRVNTSYATEIAFSVLSMALGGRQDYVRIVNFDLVRLARDHRGHWLAGVERDGHWQKGILYGNDLARDNIIGQEYPRMSKNQVGFSTRFFGDPVKVRVTRDGSVTVMSNVADADYIQFVMAELQEYMVDGVAPRRRRTF